MTVQYIEKDFFQNWEQRDWTIILSVLPTFFYEREKCLLLSYGGADSYSRFFLKIKHWGFSDGSDGYVNHIEIDIALHLWVIV